MKKLQSKRSTVAKKERREPAAPAPTQTRQVKYTSMDELRPIRTIGLGISGRVLLVRSVIEKGTVYALKRIKKKEAVKNNKVDTVMSEKYTLDMAVHPLIVHKVASFQDSYYLYLLMEYVPGGELFTQLRLQKRFPDETARFYAAQIVEAIAYLHSLSIIHRDLKPENILLTSNGYLKVTDFGFAKQIELKTYTLCGTPEYVAPEILLNKGHGKGVDWWCLGVLMYEMIIGYPPFFGFEVMNIYQKVLANKLIFPKFVNRDAKQLIKSLLHPDPTKRLGCLKNLEKDVTQHTWFEGFDWTLMATQKLHPPFVPQIRDQEDSSNYNEYPESKEKPPPCNDEAFPNW